MSLSRRRFLARSWLATLSGILVGREALATPASHRGTQERPLLVSTWPFGRHANARGLEVQAAGGSALDAVEQGIRVTEMDVSNASVGKGGLPNADGVVQLDASIMSGPGHTAGSVAAIEGILHPISVARKVMEETRHVMLVGEAARRFAIEHGCEEGELLTEERREEWRAWKAAQEHSGSPGNHDTIALLVLDADGLLAGGCSTSGWGYKLPGRVGDSPIIGSGLYVDQEIGAAGATGLGEAIMRHCGSFQVVRAMERGLHPEEACFEVVQRIARKEPKAVSSGFHFCALDREGRYGGAGTGAGFDYSVSTPSSSQVLRSSGLGAGPEGTVGDNP